jgi:hypothetical protein
MMDALAKLVAEDPKSAAAVASALASRGHGEVPVVASRALASLIGTGTTGTVPSLTPASGESTTSGKGAGASASASATRSAPAGDPSSAGAGSGFGAGALTHWHPPHELPYYELMALTRIKATNAPGLTTTGVQGSAKPHPAFVVDSAAVVDGIPKGQSPYQ